MPRKSEIPKLRKAHLLLHRKISGKRKCICGSIMVMTGNWTCTRQVNLREPASVEIYLPITPMVTKALPPATRRC